MPDIRLREFPRIFPTQGQVAQSLLPAAMFIDFVQGKNGLEEKDALATAVMVALATDGLAAVSDSLPDPYSNNREGWWGDLDANAIWNGWPIGTRLWTMRRDAIRYAGSRQGATLAKAINFATQAIQPFVDNGIISSYTVNATQTSIDRVDMKIVLQRSMSPAITLEYQYLWDEIEMRGPGASAAAAGLGLPTVRPATPTVFTLDQSVLGGDDVLG